MSLRAPLALAACLLFSPVLPAATLTWSSTLGPEAPGATGSGAGLIRFDTLSHVMSFDFSFTGLSGTTTVSHLHCCTSLPGVGTAGVAVDAPSFAGFPTGVSSGSYSGSFDLDDPASWGGFLSSPAIGGDVNLAMEALLAGMDEGRAYLNVHSNLFPGGEIRGFTARVPEPASLLLGLSALLAAAGLARRRAR